VNVKTKDIYSIILKHWT